MRAGRSRQWLGAVPAAGVRTARQSFPPTAQRRRETCGLQGLMSRPRTPGARPIPRAERSARCGAGASGASRVLPGRIQRVGLASGSARSRRPGCGPRVIASRSAGYDATAVADGSRGGGHEGGVAGGRVPAGWAHRWPRGRHHHAAGDASPTLPPTVVADLNTDTRQPGGGLADSPPTPVRPAPSSETRPALGRASSSGDAADRLHDLRLLNPVAALWRHTQQSGRL